MTAHLSPFPPDPENQVRSRMIGGEVRHPDILEDSQYGKLALLVDQGIVSNYRKIELQVRPPLWR